MTSLTTGLRLISNGNNVIDSSGNLYTGSITSTDSGTLTLSSTGILAVRSTWGSPGNTLIQSFGDTSNGLVVTHTSGLAFITTWDIQYYAGGSRNHGFYCGGSPSSFSNGNANLVAYIGTAGLYVNGGSLFVRNSGFASAIVATTLTADRTATLPNASGTFILDTATQTLTNKTLTSPVIGTGLAFSNSTFTNTLATAGLGANRTTTFPDESGTVVLSSTFANYVDSYIHTLSLDSGSAASPSLSFAADGTSGLYLITDQEIGVAINNANVLQITGSFVKSTVPIAIANTTISAPGGTARAYTIPDAGGSANFLLSTSATSQALAGGFAFAAVNAAASLAASVGFVSLYENPLFLRNSSNVNNYIIYGNASSCPAAFAIDGISLVGNLGGVLGSSNAAIAALSWDNSGDVALYNTVSIGGTTNKCTLQKGSLSANRTATFPDATGTVILDSATQTLTNKSLNTASVLFTDNGDATKKLAIDTSTNTTAITGTLKTQFTTAKTISFPDATDTVAVLATTQAFTNKTLNTGSVRFIDGADASKRLAFDLSTNTTEITGTLKTQFTTTKTITFPDATDTVAVLATAQTFTNKSLNTASVLFTDNSDATKKLAIDTSTNTTAITGTLKTQFTTAKTITFPDATDTVAVLAATQTLTNKTISGATVIGAVTTGSTFDYSASTGNFKTSSGNTYLNGARYNGYYTVTGTETIVLNSATPWSYIIFSTSATADTLTLPSISAGTSIGLEFLIIKTGSGDLQVNTASSSEYFDGISTYTSMYITQHDRVRIVAHIGVWYTV